MKITPKKTKLYQSDVHKHAQDLRGVGVEKMAGWALLDCLRRFVKIFGI